MSFWQLMETFIKIGICLEKIYLFQEKGNSNCAHNKIPTRFHPIEIECSMETIKFVEGSCVLMQQGRSGQNGGWASANYTQ